ncbi:site-specific integrase, partial [Paraburkholderia azotifigens]
TQLQNQAKKRILESLRNRVSGPFQVASLRRSSPARLRRSVTAPLLFVRPGELRMAKWDQFDFDKAQWRYTVSKTKTEHLVPLATQAMAILRELHALTGHRSYVFPGRDVKKPMSGAAINAALRRMGFDTKTEITGHGFRAMARTILHEQLRFPSEVIEHQLAHKVPDALGTAYNRTKFINDRTVMMQRWADYLDGLKANATHPGK